MWFEELSKYFGTFFLGFTLVTGYIWFFIFFFKTKHWNDLEWVERFFFGFLIGLASMMAFVLITFPLVVLSNVIYAEHVVSQLFYWIPTSFLMFLVFIRYFMGVPLSNKKARSRFLRFLTTHKSNWLYLLLIFSFGIFFGLGWNNPFLNLRNERVQTLPLIMTIYIWVLLGFSMISLLVTQLSCIPHKSSRVKAIGKALFFSFPFLKKDVSFIRGMRTKKLLTKAVLQSGLAFMKNDFFHKVIIVALLSTVIVLTDSAFHLVTPVVQIVETEYEAGEVEVFKYYSDPIIYNIKVTRTYRIRLPLFALRNLNLSIPNPSNFSVYDASKRIPWEKGPYAIKIESDSSLSYTVITNQKGELEFLNVMPTKEARGNYSFIKLTYNDKLDLDLIQIVEAKEKNLGNGSISVTKSLIADNTLPRRLHSSDFPLFSVERYGNLTSIEIFENGIKKPSHWNIIENQWLRIYLGVDPNTFMNLTVSAIFEEATT